MWTEVFGRNPHENYSVSLKTVFSRRERIGLDLHPHGNIVSWPILYFHKDPIPEHKMHKIHMTHIMASLAKLIERGNFIQLSTQVHKFFLTWTVFSAFAWWSHVRKCCWLISTSQFIYTNSVTEEPPSRSCPPALPSKNTNNFFRNSTVE